MDFPPKGSLSGTSFVQILKEAADSNLTGMIRIEIAGIVKVVYLQSGAIAFASSTDQQDRLTEVLKKAGKLTPEQVADALTRVRLGVSVGKTLVELGYISARELLWGARAQVEQIVFDLLSWQAGAYHVVAGKLPKEIINLNLSIPHVVFVGTTQSENREWILGFIGSPEAVYEQSPDFASKQESYGLPLPEMVSKFDAQTPLHEIAAQQGIDSFQVCKTAAALQLLGMIRPVDVLSRVAVEEEAEEEQTSSSSFLEREELEAFELPEQSSVSSALGTETENIAPDVPARDTSESASAPIESSLAEGTQAQQEDDQQTGDSSERLAQAVADALAALEEAEDRKPDSSSAELPPAVEIDSKEAPSDEIAISPRSLAIAALIILAGLATAYYFIQSSRNSVASPGAPAEKRAAQPLAKKSEPIAAQKPQEPQDSNTISSTVGTAPVPPTEESFPAIVQRWNRKLQEHRNGFTLQLVIACRPKVIREMIAAFPEREQVGLLPISINRQLCYRFFYGTFPSSSDAAKARTALPLRVRNHIKSSPPTIWSISKLVK